jgi:hypothetical protein
MTQENGNCPNSATSAIHAFLGHRAFVSTHTKAFPPVPCRQPTFTPDGSRLIFADSSLKTDNLFFQKGLRARTARTLNKMPPRAAHNQGAALTQARVVAAARRAREEQEAAAAATGAANSDTTTLGFDDEADEPRLLNLGGDDDAGPPQHAATSQPPPVTSRLRTRGNEDLAFGSPTLSSSLGALPRRLFRRRHGSGGEKVMGRPVGRQSHQAPGAQGIAGRVAAGVSALLPPRPSQPLSLSLFLVVFRVYNRILQSFLNRSAGAR